MNMVLPSENGSTMLVLPQRTQAFTFDGISERMQRSRFSD
jgi:hypothetical protein